MINSREEKKSSDLITALSEAKEILAQGRFGYVDCSTEALVLSSIERLLEELAVQLFAREGEKGAIALKEAAAAARQLSDSAEEAGRSNPECTCDHGEHHHTNYGCWANIPATFKEGVTDCDCLHRNGYPRTESRTYAADELGKKWAARA